MNHRPRLLPAAAMVPLAAGALLTGSAQAQAPDPNEYQAVDPADYEVPEHPGSVFFTTPDGRHCAIFWNSGPAGCDAVSVDAPAGTNQVRTTSLEPAHFLWSEEPTFTHPGAKVLPEGHRIERENTTCTAGFQGTVSCEVAEHGFILAATYSVLR